MIFPYKPPFKAFVLSNWIALHQPATIEMNDAQYAWYAGVIAKQNARDVHGVPIVFLDSVVQ